MPKFVKGSIEAKNHMAEMRAKRGLKPKVDKTDSKEHIKRVVNEALENYFISGTPVIEVPSKVVQVDKSGKAKLITTLTKAGNLKKVNGENVIKLESGDDLVIKTTGKKYNDVVNIPTHTIVHKSEPKKIRKTINATEKDFNDILDVKNEMIPIQKIIHTPHHKVKRDSIEPYNDIIEVDNIDIEPLIKKTTSTKKISKTRPKN